MIWLTLVVNLVLAQTFSCVRYLVLLETVIQQEAQVGGDKHAGALVAFAQNLEQECGARGAERSAFDDWLNVTKTCQNHKGFA